MKFKTFDLRVYRHNDETLLSFDIKGGRMPLSKLLHIPKGKPFKMKLTPEIIEKYRIKQEIKQTEYKGFVTEGVMQLADIIEEKVISRDYYKANKENWQDWMRIFVYEYLYDVAFNRGVRQERRRRKNQHKALTAFEIITSEDVSELSHELGVSEDKLTYAVMEVISKRKNGGMA
ncbi:hypothetical protein ACQUE4_09800 [Lactococcus lactis]|uniref:hypothetical protein n=1 Tax=Lactococcus TaxID=1357 RepID=UPI0028908B68|nr:hypothetical protein [Lactococcus lactis]MDT2871429.1 hypothetical protein [Lactococcus lactis]MDT2874010.1 hypothetical protein [Lactococcus lactis]MDT2878831.1 hypothetical protein [Lactococcus lactis]MDT2890495.1 hypothetical protein [Lactococcus lactis]MDT2893073.1 hypothetical protein [Lactococcus lactis]